ncbi:MAG: sigma-70 family RNA polymerase sigma factor [Planctomycetes bacterium]|nr:sigma-70 family RNA polymerase sigma factor [Planctomycetota bacterium]
MSFEADDLDAEWIERALRGERAAFEHLVLRYNELVQSYTRHLLEGDPEAEDVAQEVFLKAYRELHTLREPARFLPWLKSIAWRECRGWVRGKQSARAALRSLREQTDACQAGMPTGLEPEAYGPDPWLERLERTLERMDEGKRAVLSLFYLDELPQEAIARFLEVPLGTVKRRLFDGRREVAAAAQTDPPADLPEQQRFVHAVKRLLDRPGRPAPNAGAGIQPKEQAMKIAVFGCVHANLPALDAVLQEIDAAKPDRVYCLGDVISYGSQPRECIQRIRERGWPVLRGNHEATVLNPSMLDEFNPFARNCGFFTLGALGPEERTWIETLPLTLNEHGIFFAHASPVTGKEYLQYLLSQETFQEAFEVLPANLAFVAHTHIPLVAFNEQPFRGSREPSMTIDPNVKTIVNVGSVGQPRDRDPRACWVLYDTASREVAFRRTAYDTQESCRRIKAAGLPVKIAERILTGV